MSCLVREAYETFIAATNLRRASGNAKADDLYTVVPAGNHSSHQIDALKSFSVWGLYVTVLALIELVRTVVLQ